MADTIYNLLDDDGVIFLVNYIFQKLATSPLSENTTYSISLDTTNEWIVLTDNDGNTTHVSYSDFGEANVLEGVKVNGTELTIDGNKKVNIPLANGTAGSLTDGAMSSTDKAKLDGIATGAQVNVLEGVQVDGTDLSISSKKVNIPVAAANTKGVVTVNQINTLISSALENYERVSFLKVANYASLPKEYDNTKTYAVNDLCLHSNIIYKCNTSIVSAESWNPEHWTAISNVNGTLFLVPSGGTTPDIYDEYAWMPVDLTTTPITYGYEKMGTTAVDLSGYVQYTDITLISNNDIADIVDDAYDAVFNPTTP